MMETVRIDLKNTKGVIKPMHAVNNGPAGSRVRGVKGNFEAYKALEIPYARNHDASFYSGYGGEHTVDVHRIFKNFDADIEDPASYVFAPTDAYVAATFEAGTEVFYRLGASIEHGHKMGTYPPKDFLKWAQICEHIIRHYTEGWASGFHYDITYWEIWNEADCRNADGSNPCWQGSEEQFIDFYCTVAKHLKECFPHLKIGGPAFAIRHATEFSNKFLTRVREENIPLDFFSYHAYAKHPDEIYHATFEREKELADHGLGGTETILNEYNYIKGWRGDDWTYSLNAERSLQGASFVAGCMCACQESPLGMLMYYDARPSGMNGMFDMMTLAPLKGYYTFKMFSELYRLGTGIETGHRTGDIYHTAATDGKNAACLLTNYPDDESDTAEKQVKIEFTGAPQGAKKVEYYLLDENHDCTLLSEEIFTSDTFSVYRNFPLHATYLIKITAL